MSRDVNFRDDRYHELARAIGELALVWNDLGMVLSDLFHALTRIPNGLAADAVWNSIRSDRTQRDIVFSLAKLEALGYELESDLRADILWCLKEIEKLEDLRNYAIHSPVYQDHIGTIVAWYELGHPRAKNLANKDLLKEFGWFYDTTVILRRYCEQLSDSVCRPNEPRASRPALPNRGSIGTTAGS